MRQVTLDTETTGLDVNRGDRLIEVAAVEMIDGLRTDRHFHTMINPLCPIGMGAQRVHGITDEMVANAPLFEHIVDDLVAFIGDSDIVIHNASFDMKFLDHEMTLCARPLIPRTRVIDSLQVARRKFPGQPASLDALCNRFKISLNHRQKHSALIDSQLLADVFLELNGGRQRNMLDAFTPTPQARQDTTVAATNTPQAPHAWVVLDVSEEEAAAHDAFLKGIKGALWKA